MLKKWGWLIVLVLVLAAAAATSLYWQRGYGVFSLGEKNLERAIAYVRNQKEHHRQQRLIAALERDSDGDDGPAPWNHGEAIAGIEVIRDSQNEDIDG